MIYHDLDIKLEKVSILDSLHPENRGAFLHAQVFILRPAESKSGVSEIDTFSEGLR